MRFAYIDSQGKEIAIPTVEALQLRIELGAIVGSTTFFDASTGRWAPASEHEIFRTLQRQLREQEEGGFVAPPPPALDVGRAAAPPEPSPPPPPVSATEAPEAPTPPPPQASEADPLAGLGFDLSPLDAEGPAAAPAGPAPVEADDLPSFDLGDIGMLEMEGAEPAASEPPAPSPPPPPGSPFSEDLDLEAPLSEQSGGDVPPGWDDGALELETPLSDYTPEAPPGWMEPGAPEARPSPASGPAPRVPGGSPPPAPRGPAASGAADAPRSRPRSAPSRPASRPPERSGVAGKLAAVAVLALLGGGGWFGWSLFHGDAGADGPEGALVVEVPTLAPALEAVHAEVAPAAHAAAMDALGERVAAAALPAEPPADWLAGSYLADASRYPEVSSYWTALNAALGELREAEATVYRQAYEAALEGRTLSAEERAELVGRADVGLRAAAQARTPVWDELGGVIQASIGLHDFLLEHEDEIDHEPAAGGISRDPVLEAVPFTEALGEEMWGAVGRITQALEAMGALDERVTTERLFAVTLERLRAAPPR